MKMVNQDKMRKPLKILNPLHLLRFYLYNSLNTPCTHGLYWHSLDILKRRMNHAYRLVCYCFHNILLFSVSISTMQKRKVAD